MSDNIPFELQTEIFKRLPVKSLIQIRPVCKSWKSVIDSPDFVKNYSGQQQYLLARYKNTFDSQEDFVLIADDETFPQKRVSLNSHLLVNMFKYSHMIGSSHGLLCLYGDFQLGCDGPFSSTGRAVIWNPSIRKAVAVDVPNMSNELTYETFLGFGVCRETTDPKIVKITYIISRWINIESIPDSIPWQVEVFTLSTGAWRCPYSTSLPRKSIHFERHQIVIDGTLYWLATDSIVDDGFKDYNLIVSFDTRSEEFRELNLPDNLAHLAIGHLSIYKLRESLVVLEHVLKANKAVICVWVMGDGVPNSFTKLFTIDLPDVDVTEVYITGFRKTGEPVIDSASRYPEWTGSLAVYEPYSKSIRSLRVDGRDFSCYEYSYIESILML